MNAKGAQRPGRGDRRLLPEVDCPLYGEDYVAVIHTAPQVEFTFLPWLQQQLGTLRAPQRVMLSHQALPLNGAGKARPPCARRLLQREAS
ncbi:hypothetical protein P4234_28595 [Pseudomonas aeruginosa]|nr:hypothetical protein [Pseudomonas aeruginosa]